jgi:O-antigen/teichoic acid export membrane protein
MRHLHQIQTYLDRHAKHPIVRGAMWLFVSKGLRLVLQSVYFVAIARTLGVEKYGEFVSIAALSSILAPFVGLGTDLLLLKNVAKDRSLFATSWGNSLLTILVTGVGAIGLLGLVAPLLLPHTILPLSIFLIATSDLIFGSIIGVAGHSFQAVDRLNISAQLSVFNMLMKVFAALALVHFFPHPQTIDWVYLYLASSIISATLALIVVQNLLGPPKLAVDRIKAEISEGVYFAISSSAYTIYNDIDKTMLAKLSTLSATGIYAAAYRLIDVAFIPVMSIAGAAYADFFRKGKEGIRATVAFARPLVAISSGYSVLAGIGLLFLSPIVPYILGDEYINVVPALRWLAPIPLFRSMQHFGGDILSGSGFQSLRSAIEVFIAVFNIAINLWLIPAYSWQGAAWASLASDGLLMLTIWTTVAIFYRKQSLESP